MTPGPENGGNFFWWSIRVQNHQGTHQNWFFWGPLGAIFQKKPKFDIFQIPLNALNISEKNDKTVKGTLSLNNAEVDWILSIDANKLPKNIANEKQLNKFKKAIINFPTVRKSLAASHGIFINNNYHFDITRPGVALFGGIKDRNILNVVNIELPVLQTHFLNADEGIGYGLTYFSKEKKRVATLAGGYADGLTRNFSNIGFQILLLMFS